MTFMPEGYEKPKSGGSYMKLQQGENRLRILSSPIVGWLDRDKSGDKPHPVRTRDKQPPLSDKSKPKHFRAMAVYDYATDSVKIWEVTQSSIQDAILSMAHDSERGDPKKYDLKITRSGESLETKYTVVGSPNKGDITDEQKEIVRSTPMNLDALYDGADPFDVDSDGDVDDDQEFNG